MENKKKKSTNSFEKAIMLEVMGKYFLLIATILVSVMFAIASPSFLKVTNILDIFRAASIIGIMGIGLTIVQSTGDFDFAIGAEATVGACAIAKIMVELIPNFYIAFLLTMIVVACIGLFNSYIVINIGMQAFVATFGVSTLMVGICKFLTGGGQYYSTSWPSGFSILGQGFVLGIIPVSVILLALCTIIAFVFMEKTKTGRYIYAVGANPVAAQHVGINIRRNRRIAFVVCSMFAGFAGIIQASMLSNVTPSMGDSNFLPAMSTCMLGATFLRPGVFNILGTILGYILLAVISNGLTMVGASFFLKDIIQGAVLIFAVGFVAVIRHKR